MVAVTRAARGVYHSETASLGSLDHSGTWWSWSCWDQAEEGKLRNGGSAWLLLRFLGRKLLKRTKHHIQCHK